MFATNSDRLLMALGSLGAIGMGMALRGFVYALGKMTNAFVYGGDQMVDAARSAMFMFFALGVGAFCSGWLAHACWSIAGRRQAIACRKAYFQALLRQEVEWFDLSNQEELLEQFTADCVAF